MSYPDLMFDTPENIRARRDAARELDKERVTAAVRAIRNDAFDQAAKECGRTEPVTCEHGPSCALECCVVRKRTPEEIAAAILALKG